jgi:predicted transposase/invertase (TIGR01784 family)
MPTRIEVLMRSANLLNDFAFKYVFGEDCKEANDALKSLLTVFLERKVNHVVVKNSEMVKDYSKMKNSRLDLLVEFDDQTTVDLEMQLRQTKDHLPNRFNYYLARLHGSQDMEGKSYSQLKETIVMIFFNLIIVDDDEICSTFTMRKWSGIPFVKESEDRMKLMTIEMPKVDLNKPLEDMNEQEKMIYYFLNCHKGMDDSKIRMMVEKDVVIQMLEKRVETISDDRWKKIIEDFQKLHENEERIELQLELEEANKKVNQMNQEMKQMIQLMLSNGMSLEYVSKSLSKSENEILDLMK